MIAAGLTPLRGGDDARVKQELDDLVRDDGYVADVARDDIGLDVRPVWRMRRGQHSRRRGQP